MAKLALVAAFLVSFIPAACGRQASAPAQHFETISAPVYVEPMSRKGR